MWYIIPTPPHIVEGREKSSGTSMMYALRDLPPSRQQGFEAARAYLAFPETKGVNLRRHYVEMMTAIGDQLEAGVKPLMLMGYADDPKLRSSCRLFEFVSRGDPDLRDVHEACARVLDLLKETALQGELPAASERKETKSEEVKPEREQDKAERGRAKEAEPVAEAASLLSAKLLLDE